MTWKVDREYDPRRQITSLFIREIAGKGRINVVTDFKIKHVEATPGTILNEVGVIEMMPETAENFMQAFMECAWDMGLRPKGVGPMENELNAVRDHLEDMRTVALHKYKK